MCESILRFILLPCCRGVERYCTGAASGSADADKKEKAPKGGTAVKVTILYISVSECFF